MAKNNGLGFIGNTNVNGTENAPRGWWDYVPEASQSNGQLHSGTPRSNKSGVQLLGNKQEKLNYPPPGAPGSSQLSRASSVTFSLGRSPASPGGEREAAQDLSPARRRLSTASSAMSRLSKYMPRMQLLKEVLRNEVCTSAHCRHPQLISVAALLYSFLDGRLPGRSHRHAGGQSRPHPVRLRRLALLRL